MKKIFWILLFIPFIGLSQTSDTAYVRYIAMADSAYAIDQTSLKAYSWYMKAIVLTANNADTATRYADELGDLFEVFADMSYMYELYNYSNIFYDRALEFYRLQNRSEKIYGVIPKIALTYKAMRISNMNIAPLESDNLETAEVYYTILEKPKLENNKLVVRINGGITDGIYPTSTGYVYGKFNEKYENRSNTLLGQAEIKQLDTNTAFLYVTPAVAKDSFHTVLENDMVMMLSQVPQRKFKSIFWELALNQIIFINQNNDPIYDYRQLLFSDSEVLENEILEIMKKDILDTWQWLNDLEDKSEFDNFFVDVAEEGRYKGITGFEAMGKTTNQDIESFLGFVKSFPGKYMGTPYKINETYATWLVNGCAIGVDEFITLVNNANTTESLYDLADKYETAMVGDEFIIQLHIRAEELAKNGFYKEAKELNRKSGILSVAVNNKNFIAWTGFNIARIYDMQNKTDSAVYHYERSIPLFEEAENAKGKAYCLNNLGSMYETKEQFEEASKYYKNAYRTKLFLFNNSPQNIRPDYFYSLSKSASGIGNTEYYLSNYDSALVAYANAINWADSTTSLEGKVYAVSLQTDMARVYKRRGQYEQASKLYENQVKRYLELGEKKEVAAAYDNMADVLFSKGEYQGAFDKFFEAHKIKADLLNWSGAGFSLSNCGQAFWNLGNLDSAIALHNLALQYREKGEDENGMAYSFSKIAELYKEIGEPEKAKGYYQNALDIYIEVGDSLKIADLAEDIGEYFYDLKNYTRALEYYNYALKMYEGRGMKSEIANSNASIGSVYFQLKNFQETKRFYNSALKIRQEIGERQSTMYSLVDMSLILMAGEYKFDSAMILLNNALDLAIETGSKDYQAYCHQSIGNAYFFQAKSQLADQEYTKALIIYKETGDLTNQCAMLLNLGANELEKGNFKKALSYYNESKQIAAKNNLALQVANSYNYLSEYYYYTGEFEKAFSVTDSAYALFVENDNLYGIAGSYIVRGNTHNLLGNGSVAVEYYQLADSIYTLLKDPLSRATALNNTATIKFFQGDYNSALVLLNRCKTIFDTTQVRSNLLNSVYTNLGELYMEKGIWEESEIWLKKGIDLAVEMGAKRQEWGDKTIYGKLLMKQGKYQESIEIMKGCYAAFKLSDEKMAIGETATNLGKAYHGLGNLDLAKQYFSEALTVYRTIGSKKMIWEPLYQLAEIEKEQDNTLTSIAYLTEAIDTLEILSNDIVGSQADKKLFAKANDKKNIYESLITQLVESGSVKQAWLYQEKLNVYGLEEQTRGDGTRGAADANTEEGILSDLELKVDGIYSQLMKEKAKPADQRSVDKIQELEKRMSVASENYQNFFWDLVDNGVISNDFSNSINPEELDQMRFDLDPDIIVLEYLVTDNQLIIFTASADTLGAKVIDINKEELENYINGYYHLLTTDIEKDAINRASEQLYNVLITPIAAMLNDKKKIAFIPTGVLYKLPYQSLGKVKNSKMRYLVEDFEIFYLNDIRSTANNEKLDVDGTTLLAFGNADSSLKFAEVEVGMISQTFPDAVVYIKSEAQENLAKTSMNDYQIVHFATHGNLDPIDFNNSYLTMAPNMDAGEDGKLTMKEINRIRTLRGCQLIVLSACNTAVNDEKLEGWINNPAKAFLRKGAKTAIASLWSVDDAATGQLMQHFYQNLKAGQSKSEALNNAQKSLVATEKFNHPYYWAAFELIGQWQ